MEGIKTGAEIKTDSKTPSRAEKVKPQIGMMVSSISNILRNSTNGDFRKECFKITNVKHRQDFDKALMVKFEDFLMCNHGINISEKIDKKEVQVIESDSDPADNNGEAEDQDLEFF